MNNNNSYDEDFASFATSQFSSVVCQLSTSTNYRPLTTGLAFSSSDRKSTRVSRNSWTYDTARALCMEVRERTSSCLLVILLIFMFYRHAMREEETTSDT